MKKKLLIIEDDRVVARIYEMKFTAEGYEVRVAGDGEAGISAFDAIAPDAVLLDLMLPKGSGVEILRYIRAKPGFKTLPVVVFSNMFVSDMVEEAWRAGASKCLSKAAVTPRQLIQIMNSLVLGTGGGAAAGTAPAGGTDLISQADLRRNFITALPGSVFSLKQTQQSLAQSENRKEQLPLFLDLYRIAHSITSNAGLAGVPLIARMSSALEAMLRELHEKPVNISPSTLRTISQAVAFMGVLAERVDNLPDMESMNARVLAVDDDLLSLRAVLYSLEKAGLSGQGMQSPAEALDLLTIAHYDLVILDIEMPGMTGFELCKKLRAIPAHAETPVIYVTALADFQNRARGIVTGANDLIAKPFLFIELALKTLVYLLKRHLPKPPPEG